MALLTEQQIDKLMRKYQKKLAAPTISQAQLRAAMVGADTYAENNASAMNTAIPQPARAELSQLQKAAIYALVFAERYGVDI